MRGRKRPRDKLSQGRLLLHILFLVGLTQLGGLLGLPVIQQGDDLVLHLTGGLVLAEILFQFHAVDNHLVYLLFLLTQNTVNDIAVERPLFIQLPQFLRLGQGRRGLLPLNGNGDIPLMLGTDKGNLHGRGKRQLLFVQHFLQIRDEFSQADIPLHLLIVHAVAIPDNLRGALSGVLIVLTGPSALVLDSLHLLLQRFGFLRGQNLLTVAQVVISHGEDGLVIRHFADDTGHIGKSGQLAGPLAAVSGDDLIAAALTGTHQRRLINASRLDRLHQPLHFRIVTDAKGVVLEWVQLRKIEIYDLLFFGSGSVTGLGGLLWLGRSGGLLLGGGALLWDILSRLGFSALVGVALSFLAGSALLGAALSALDGRPRRGCSGFLCSLSGGSTSFAGGVALPVSSRAAAKSTTLPGVEACCSGLSGSGCSGIVTPGNSGASGMASPISKRAACPSCSKMSCSSTVSASGPCGAGAAVSARSGTGLGCSGASVGIPASWLMVFLSSAT